MVSFSHGDVEVDVERVGDRLEHALEVLRVGAAPGRDRTVGDRLLGIGDHELGVDLERRAQAVALLARAVRRVEREVARRRLVVRRVAHRARQVLAERHRLRLAVGVDDLELGHTVGELQRGLERIGEPALDAFAEHEPVDDDFDLVLLVPRQPLVALEELVDDDRLTVDASPHVPLPGQVGEQCVVLALAPADDRREHLEAGALGHLDDAVDDLLRCLALEAGAVVGAVLDADPGVQQPEVVVDLGDRADRRPRVAARRLLVDRDRR